MPSGKSLIQIIVDENVKTMRELPRKQWELIINIGSYRISSSYVTAIDRIENYIDDAFSNYMVTALFRPSDVTNLILPGANKLEATLIAKDMSGNNQLVFKYRLVLSSNIDYKLMNNDNRSSDIRELNSITMVSVSFQMIDHATFDLRLAQTGNIYPKTVPMNALVALLSKFTLNDEYGASDAVAGFDITPGFSQEQTTVVVRDGTPVRSLSRVIQESVGLYSQGCSCFMKDRVWWIFPTYGVFSEGDMTKNHRLVIINAPPNRYSSIRRNYRKEGTTTTIVASGKTTHQNTSDTDSLNGATGVMYGKSSSLLGGTSNLGEGVTSAADKYLVEYDAAEYKGRERNIAVPRNAFISNETHMSTMLASKAGDIVDVTWEHGDISKITPGCAVTFITQDENRIRKLYGTVLSAQSLSCVPEKGIVEKMHQENVGIKLFLKREPV